MKKDSLSLVKESWVPKIGNVVTVFPSNNLPLKFKKYVDREAEILKIIDNNFVKLKFFDDGSTIDISVSFIEKKLNVNNQLEETISLVQIMENFKKLQEGEENVMNLQSTWNTLSPSEQEDKLLTVYKDPDDAEKYIGMDWEELPEDVTNRLSKLKGDELDEGEEKYTSEDILYDFFFSLNNENEGIAMAETSQLLKYLQKRKWGLKPIGIGELNENSNLESITFPLDGILLDLNSNRISVDDAYPQIDNIINKVYNEGYSKGYNDYAKEIEGDLDEATYLGRDAKDDLKRDPKYNTLAADTKKKAEQDLDKGGSVTIGEEKIEEEVSQNQKNKAKRALYVHLLAAKDENNQEGIQQIKDSRDQIMKSTSYDELVSILDDFGYNSEEIENILGREKMSEAKKEEMCESLVNKFKKNAGLL